jgi:quercetin dioxygenase-like cupin family protein
MTVAHNLGTVAGIYEAFGRGDVASIIDQLDDDVAWEEGIRPNGLSYYQPGRGKAHVGAFFEHLMSTLELTHFEPLALCGGGDVVSVPVRHAGRIIGGGEIPMNDEVHVWRFGADGKVVAFNHILDLALHEQAAAERSKQYEGRTLCAVGETLQVLQAGEPFEVFELTGTVDGGPPPHAHPWIESYYGLAGETEVIVEDTTTVLRPGDFLSAPADALHTFRTLTPDARFLVMTSGPRASAFFADIDANVPAGPPNEQSMPVLVDVAKRNGVTSPLFA